MANVIFKTGTKAQYDSLTVKGANTLYWLTDVLELRKGEILYGKGAEATSLASGLMSAADKKALDTAVTDIADIRSSIIWGSFDDGEETA